MKNLVMLLFALCTAFTPCTALSANSWQNDMTKEEYNAVSANENSNSSINSSKDSKEERFFKIATDSSYFYYVDTRTFMYRQMPSSRHQYIDVWVKLIPISNHDPSAATSADYYLLHHYYICQKTQEIKCLSTSEIFGVPQNTPTGVKYNPRWEKLVPGSIADTVFQGIVDNIDLLPSTGKNSDFKNIGDGIEDVLRISI